MMRAPPGPTPGACRPGSAAPGCHPGRHCQPGSRTFFSRAACREKSGRAISGRGGVCKPVSPRDGRPGPITRWGRDAEAHLGHACLKHGAGCSIAAAGIQEVLPTTSKEEWRALGSSWGNGARPVLKWLLAQLPAKRPPSYIYIYCLMLGSVINLSRSQAEKERPARSA